MYSTISNYGELFTNIISRCTMSSFYRTSQWKKGQRMIVCVFSGSGGYIKTQIKCR